MVEEAIWAVECDAGTGQLSVANLLFLEMGGQFNPQACHYELEVDFRTILFFGKPETGVTKYEIRNRPVL